MNKLILAIALTTVVAAALPATAAPRSPATATTANMAAQSTLQAGEQCFKATDSSRGFGYWTHCDNVYAFTLGRRGLTVSRSAEGAEGADGGGGDGGGGGGGGGR